MSIYISNNLYLTGGLGPETNANNPIIGWHSILTPPDISASNTVIGRSAINMWNPDTSSVWQGSETTGSGAVSTSQLIDLYNTGNQPFDYVGIAKHNFGDVGFTYSVEHSTNGGSSWSTIAGPRIIGTNDAIIDYFDQKTSGRVRLRIEKTVVGVGVTIAAPIIAHIKLGVALVLQRRIYVGHRPATIAKNVRKIANGSESGQYLGTIVTRSYHTTSVNQENNSPAFVRAKIKPFIDHINGHLVANNTAPCTFFFAWRPGDYPLEVVYGWTSENIQPENQGSDAMGGRMKWGFEMECVA